MDLSEDLLLPLLLVAIVANTAIIVLLFVTGRLGRDKRVTATTARSATMEPTLMPTSYVDRSAAATWAAAVDVATPVELDETTTAEEPEPMAEATPDVTVVPVAEAPVVPTPAGIDPLTGLPDASAFVHLVADEDARVQRYHRPATVVIFELDGLDRLTDRLGQDAADRIVPALADTIRRLARGADHVARLGPGRFAALLPETDEVAAINYVERVRRACELWLESGAIALRLAIGWAGTAGDPSLPDAQRIATDRMYVELRRAARRSEPSAVDPADAGLARTESEDDIPS